MAQAAQQPYLESAFKLAQTRLAEMKAERQSWDSHYRELQDYFLTRRGRWITDSKTNRGEKRNQKLVDPTPRIAARTLGAGMHAGSTNPASPWLKLTTPDPETMELPGVSRWLYAIENWMRDVFERSNLYSVLPNIYTEAGVFGTAPMVMLEHPDKVINFVPKTVGSYYLAKNSDGVVDTMYCEYTMTTRQLVDDFGIDNVSTVVKGEWEQGKRNQQHEVLHIIEPREGAGKSPSSKDMPWKSCYYELKHGEEKTLRESGFEENPIAAFLWETTEITDAYGSSCGMDALGCAKAMQLQQKRKAQAIDKLIDPPMVGDPALKNQPSSLIPGDVTWAGFTQSGSAPKFQPAYTIKPELQGLMLDIEDVRNLVEDAMYTKLFFAITRADPRNASVPEIDARKEEQILALGPVLQNHVAFIKNVVDRTFYIGMRQGRLPPPPPELEGVELKVELTGALAQAFKAIAGQKIERFAMYVGSIAKSQAESGQEVTAWDKFDAEQSIDEYALAIGVPPSVVRSDDVVAQIQEQRAQQRQAQAAAAQAQPMKDAAMAAKAMSETKMGQGSALDEMVAA